MKLYDVSLPLYPGMITWPGDPKLEIELAHDMAAGAAANVSRLVLGTHAGTHVDAPHHFIPDGPGVDAIDPDKLIGPVRVCQFPVADVIDTVLLRDIDFDGVSRILLGTRNSALLASGEITEDYSYLTPEAANFLVAKGIKLVGIDYLSIEKAHYPGHPTHLALLEAGVVVIEGLDLSDVPAGDYELFCLPLRIRGADGAPARVFLRSRHD